ncbi:MAG: hypothetical protein RI936_1438 [Pseudomonadota bacterium]
MTHRLVRRVVLVLGALFVGLVLLAAWLRAA